MIGRTISHYHVVSQPGGGGIGLEYEAEDFKLHRGVALKFLPGELANDPDTRELFQGGAYAASALPGEISTSFSASEIHSSNRDLCMSVQTKVRVR